MDQSQFLEPVWVYQLLLSHTDGDEDMGVSLRRRLDTRKKGTEVGWMERVFLLSCIVILSFTNTSSE